MNLHRPAYLAFITKTIPTIHPHTAHPVNHEKQYTWRKAEDLVPGDVFLTESGAFNGEIYNVYPDADGVWVEDTHSEGYLNYGSWFRVAH